MNKLLAMLIITSALAAGVILQRSGAQPLASLQSNSPCKQIASLAPSVSILLNKLKLSDNISIASRYDNFTKERTQRILGGYQDTKVETLIEGVPSITIGLKEHQSLLKQANSFGLKTLIIDHNRLSTYLDSIILVGDICSRGKLSKQVRIRIENDLKRYKETSANYPLKSALALYLQERGDIETAFVLGQNSFFSDLLPFFNLTNWLKSNSHMLKELKSNMLLRTPPDIIFVIASSAENGANDLSVRQLESLRRYPGFTKAKIESLSSSGFTYPGLHFNQTLKELAIARNIK
jgi:ABC-type Fe3+-hydroxamate transport system substrate-binding protein